MNDIELKLRQNLPANLLSQILFLNSWVEPPDFRTMSKEERKKIYNKFLGLSTDPTPDNYWVWFGVYSKPDYMPNFHGERVVRVLYEAIREPLRYPDGRVRKLVNCFATEYSDVNLFKYVTGVGRGTRYRHSDRLKILDAHGVTFDQLADQKRSKERLQKIEEVSKLIEEYRDAFPTKASMLKGLLMLRSDEIFVRMAISQSDLTGDINADPDHENLSEIARQQEALRKQGDFKPNDGPSQYDWDVASSQGLVPGGTEQPTPDTPVDGLGVAEPAGAGIPTSNGNSDPQV